MRYQIDFEFREDGRTIEPISLGIVAQDGRELYIENADFDPASATDWLRVNVLPYLHGAGRPLATWGALITEFVGPEPEFWGWYADYDWIALCQLYGRMIDLPPTWPMFCRDSKQLHADLGSPTLPPHRGTEHHALDDARHQVEIFDFLNRRRPAALFYDAEWSNLLGLGLLEEIDHRFDFTTRFAGVADVGILPPGGNYHLHRGPGRSTGPVAWVRNKMVEVSTSDDDLVVPNDAIAFEATLDLDDMISWAHGHLRSDVVDACVASLEAAMWERIEQLFSKAGASPRRGEAERSIERDAGVGKLIDLELPSGIFAVAQEGNLTLAVGAGLEGSAGLAPDGEHWYLRGRLPVSTCLLLKGARRLHAEGPGPAD